MLPTHSNPRGSEMPRASGEPVMHGAYLFRHCARQILRTCHGRGPWGQHGPGGHPWEGREEEMDDDCFPGGGFGVRRPLRFLAHKLDLDDRQITALARILDELR